MLSLTSPLLNSHRSRCKQRSPGLRDFRRSTMKMSTLLVTVMAAMLIWAPANSQDKVNTKEESAKKVKELQKERINTLKDMADEITTLHRSGRASHEEVYEARLLALKAELDAAEKESHRITLHKKIVDVLKGYEAVTEAKVNAGQLPHSSYLKLKAKRLEAEIHLEKEKVYSAEK
jgi:hypothetical protein